MFALGKTPKKHKMKNPEGNMNGIVKTEDAPIFTLILYSRTTYGGFSGARQIMVDYTKEDIDRAICKINEMKKEIK